MCLIDRQAAIDGMKEYHDMSDLISREGLLKRVEESWKNAGLHSEDYRKIKKWIRSVPSAQEWISVVRCKDCKHRVVNENYGKRGYLRIRAYCELDSGDIFALGRNADEDDWFCADAELKEESKGGE